MKIRVTDTLPIQLTVSLPPKKWMAKEDVCLSSCISADVHRCFCEFQGGNLLVFRGDLFCRGKFLPPAFFPTGNARKILRMIGMFSEPSKKWRSKSLVKANGILERTKLMENCLKKFPPRT